jgi:hypothetical protein
MQRLRTAGRRTGREVLQGLLQDAPAAFTGGNVEGKGRSKMSRLIDADALIEKIREINPVDYGNIFSYEAHGAAQDVLYDIKQIVCNAPTVEPMRGEWISVDDRLPEDISTYLIVIKEKDIFNDRWNYEVDVAYSQGSYIDNFWDTFNDWCEGQEVHVTHWMPLPEPPQEDKP